MRPILKWTGGKSSEIPNFFDDFPETYDRYIEPFLGGGAVFFKLEHSQSIVNDFNKELITFYNLLNNPTDFGLFDTLISEQHNYRLAVANIDCSSLDKTTIFDLAKHISSDPDYHKFLTRELKSKERSNERINEANTKKGKPLLTAIEEATNYKTGIYAALYYACRIKYNTLVKEKAFNVEHIAYWFVMRELAFSGMFRFSPKGDFNVPYGGISYNTKDMSKKLTYIKKVNVENFFISADFNNLDFEDLFIKYNYFNKNDFIFLDPPYDSNFSQYNVEKDFTSDDQTRLRDACLKLNAKMMMVVKDTDFIKSLYEKDFKIVPMKKTYGVNFRNRKPGNLKVTHLIITNY